MRSAALVSLICAVACGNDLPDDVGYFDLFADALEEIEDAPLELQGDPIPDYLDGVFFQTGPAHWSFLMDHVKSPSAVAGAGKVHKWAFENGKVFFTTKFPQKIMVPNVNVFLMNKNELAVLTDGPIMTMVDPKNLSFERFVPVVNNGTGIPSAASAHPYCARDGSYIGLRETLTGGMGVFKLHPSSPDVIQEIAHVKVPYAAYSHSFGLTEVDGVDYAAIVRQPIPVGFGPPWRHDADVSRLSLQTHKPRFGNSHLHLLPMDNGVSGKKPLAVELDRFFFGHFINTFSPGPGKLTFDLDRQQEIFFSRFNLDIQGDKAKRDSWAEENHGAYSTPTRYEVDLKQGTVNQTKLFSDPATQCNSGTPTKWCEFDLFALHPDDIGQPYCGFWAQQWFFNSSSFGSWAIVRVELCGQDGPKVVAHWYQRNAYPGEPQFVPRPGAKDKTDGIIMFKTYEGDTGLSKFVIVDAKTLETKTTAILPRRIPFTVHGHYYSKAQLEAGSCSASELAETVI